MIQVEQRVVDAVEGDCFAACLASILELPLDAVPNPHDARWFLTMQRWLWETHRLAIVVAQSDLGTRFSAWPGQALVIASVPSVLFEGRTHAVVWDLGRHELVYDPSPQRDVRGGVYPPPSRYWLLVPAAGEPARG